MAPLAVVAALLVVWPEAHTEAQNSTETVAPPSLETIIAVQQAQITFLRERNEALQEQLQGLEEQLRRFVERTDEMNNGQSQQISRVQQAVHETQLRAEGAQRIANACQPKNPVLSLLAQRVTYSSGTFDFGVTSIKAGAIRANSFYSDKLVCEVDESLRTEWCLN
jgi:TolA-binding protein